MRKLHFFKPRISTSSAFGVFVHRTLEVVLRGKPKLVKPKFFWGVPLALFSLEVYLGAVFGYFAAKFFSGKEAGDPAKIKSLAFNIGKYRLHFHHWFYGLGILAFVFLLGLSFPFPQFSFGFLGGFIFQGVSCYPDWYKVLSRQKRV